MAASRRAFLGAVATGIAGSLAGCPATSPGPGGGASGMGSVGGDIPTNSTISPDQWDTVVETGADLDQQLQQRSGDIIGIPDGAVVDLTGRGTTIDDGNVVASTRGIDGSTGGMIVTQDQGEGTPVMDNALLTVNNGRISGTGIRGQLYNYTDSDVIPGYVPFAPGSSRSARDAWRADRVCRAISIQSSDAIIDNCEIWGWSTGIMVGAKGNAVDPYILQCYIHDTMLTSYGYCVDVKRGVPTIYQSLFDAYRHAVNGYGYADAGYKVIECVFGPHCCGHVIDMHGVHNNAPDGGSSDPSALDYKYRAGGRMEVSNSKIMPRKTVDNSMHNGADAGTWEPSPYVNRFADVQVPHVKVRGVPADGFYFRNNDCALSDPKDALKQEPVVGSTNDHGFRNLFFEGNRWGVDFS